MSDQMPTDIFRKLRLFAEHLFHFVLTEIAQSERIGLFDCGDRLGLAHSDQSDALARAPRPRTGALNIALDFF